MTTAEAPQFIVGWIVFAVLAIVAVYALNALVGWTLAAV